MDVGLGRSTSKRSFQPWLRPVQLTPKSWLRPTWDIYSPSIGNTLWRVSTMFMRSAITSPEVNGFDEIWGTLRFWA